ncbi:von Willebrand factor A domain-containing protein 8 [Amphibalanus amphitrite]|uniref:von Willebrand factor A domain-containing protein 8 n=1 Tax=Amphibalanus amphitrite TaxID=1232801 RepID=A0A6A4VNZ0_AMPAM|nr:von Willebrand factor A domain-containing protein 8 [Amphibalanus amphitrite]
MTRRSVFSWCGRIVAHLPVCGWLRPATAWLKRRVNSLTRGWDDVTHDAALREQLKHVAERLASEDPARGQWCVTGHRAVLWTDASSIAAGVVLESEGGDVIEDACWLRRDEATHINMAELDAAVRGINLALAWDMKTVELKTDSATVHRWVSDALSGRARLRTKAHGEMLIRRRVDVIRQLVAELGISLTVSLVRSSQNRSDTLTRVPSLWLRQDSQPADQRPSDGQPVAAAAVVGSEVGDGGGAVTVDFRQAVTDVHVRAGHPGVRRTLYFARRDVSSSISRKVVREVVTACDVCRAVDPAPVTWRHGSLAVEGTWDRLAIDVTHYGGQSYLSVIDCGPSRFCVWRLLRRSDAATVTSELEQVFAERGAPAELLADNDTAFRSRQFAAFAARWGVLLRFRAVHRPSGNSIVERNHRSVKVIAARKKCGIGEAVHLYNITPRDGGTAAEAPANGQCAPGHERVVRAVTRADLPIEVRSDLPKSPSVSAYLEVTDLPSGTVKYLPVQSPSSHTHYYSWASNINSTPLFVAGHGAGGVVTVDTRGVVRLWETATEQLTRSAAHWARLVGDDSRPVQVTYERESGKDVEAPKHGKVDATNAPHVGGNTWAGGTGGRDTAGLGGKGGPYRLDAGHDVTQVSPGARGHGRCVGQC